MKRFLTLLLACLMLLPALAACGTGTTPAQPTGTTPSDDGTQAPGGEQTTEDLWAPAQDLTKLNFNNEKVRLLQCEYKKAEFQPEGGTGDIVEQAVYSRNSQVEADLDIIFDYKTVASNMSSANVLEKAIESDRMANDDSSRYHIVAQPSYYVMSIMMKGHYLNLGSVKNSYIDLNRNYWLDSYVEASIVNDSYYFVTGEVAYSILDEMEVVFANKALVNNYFSDMDLYQMVYDKEWTYAKMLELIAEAGDGESTGTYGLTMDINSLSIDGMLCAMKLTMIDKNENGMPTVNINTQRNIDIVEKLRALYRGNESVKNSNALKTFSDGNAIFFMNMASNAASLYQNEIEYTLIPMPMYDSEQDDYVVAAHDEYSILSICVGVSNPEKYTAVLEDLAYRSHKTTYEAKYTKLYTARYAQIPENAEMFAFLYEHLNFSMGYIYSYVLGDCKNTPRYLLYGANVTPNYLYGVGSTFETLEESVIIDLNEFIEFFFGKN